MTTPTTLTAIDRNKELALESRVMQFHQAYLKEATTDPELKELLVLDERGETHLRSLLYEAGYLRERETPVYRRLSVDRQTGKPAIDVFEFRDVLANEKGFSYIGLNNMDEWNVYVKARDARLAEKTSGGTAWGMGLTIGVVLVGGVVDLMCGLIDHDSQTWNPSAWWLLVPPLVGGSIFYAIGQSIEFSEEETIKKNTASFREQYQSKITTGPKAILRAFGYNLPEISQLG